MVEIGFGPHLAAAVTMLGATIGAGYAIAVTGSAAIGAMAEKPEIMGKALIIVALAEALAIYGLVVALMMIMGR